MSNGYILRRMAPSASWETRDAMPVRLSMQLLCYLQTMLAVKTFSISTSERLR